MQFAEGERDIVMYVDTPRPRSCCCVIRNWDRTDNPRSLQHRFEIELKDGTKQTRTSTLIEYGSADPNGYSAMAKLGELS